MKFMRHKTIRKSASKGSLLPKKVCFQNIYNKNGNTILMKYQTGQNYMGRL